MLTEIKIKTDQDVDLTVTEFVDTLESLKIEKRNV
jgi:hypothetical protein